jgi:hypothetical protein
MSLLVHSTIGLVIILLALDALILLMVYVGVYFVKPRWPEWWRHNIVDLDPSELDSLHKLSPMEAMSELSEQPVCLMAVKPPAPANEICNERSQMAPVVI